jgi:hypothetical protein
VTVRHLLDEIGWRTMRPVTKADGHFICEDIDFLEGDLFTCGIKRNIIDLGACLRTFKKHSDSDSLLSARVALTWNTALIAFPFPNVSSLSLLRSNASL